MLKCLLVSVQQSNAGVYFYVYFVCCLQKVVVGGHGSSGVCDHINVVVTTSEEKSVYIFLLTTAYALGMVHVLIEPALKLLPHV